MNHHKTWSPDVVKLNDVEMTMARMIGNARHLTKAKEKRVGSPTSSRRDEIIGSMGEIAFARYMNVYPNLGIDVQPGSHDYLISGVTFDVKSTYDPSQTNNLVVPAHKKEKGRCDVYVLVSVKDSVCWVAGWAFDTIVFASPVKNLGWGDSYFVERKNLQSMIGIWEVVRSVTTRSVDVGHGDAGTHRYI